MKIKIEWTLINQRRNTVELNHGNDGNSEQSSTKK